MVFTYHKSLLLEFAWLVYRRLPIQQTCPVIRSHSDAALNYQFLLATLVL